MLEHYLQALYYEIVNRTTKHKNAGSVLFKKFKKLHFGIKVLLISFVVVIFLSSAAVVLGMKGVSIASIIMQYDENGNSKWFTPKPTIVPFEIQPYSPEAVIEQINERRTEEGLDALTKDNLLTQAAEAKSKDMMDRNYYDYSDPDGKDYWIPIIDSGYDYENAYITIEQGYTFVYDVINSWFNNTETKKNILDKKYKDIGISVRTGIYQGTKSTLVVVYYANKQLNNMRNTQTVPTIPPLIDCVLYTGRHIQADKATCDDFTARRYDPYESTSKNSSTRTKTLLDNARVNANHAGRQECSQLAYLKADRCVDSCLTTYKDDMAICQFGRDNGAWETDRFDECRSDIDSKHNTCSDGCTITMNSEFKQCEQKFPL